MRTICVLWGIFSLWAVSVATVRAAEVVLEEIVLAPDGVVIEAYFSLDGPIAGDEIDQIEALLAAEGAIVPDAGHYMEITLNSPGGSFPGGIDLLDYFVETGITTRILAEDQCLSACAVAFMGGRVRRLVGDEVFGHAFRGVEPGATLGFHAPSLVLPETDTFRGVQVASAYSVALDAVGALMDRETIIDPTLVRTIVQTDPDDMYIVENVDDFGRWNIIVFWREDGWQPNPEDMARICVQGWFWWEEDRSLASFALSAEDYDRYVADTAAMIQLFDTSPDGLTETYFVTVLFQQGCLLEVTKDRTGWTPIYASFPNVIDAQIDISNRLRALVYPFQYLPFDTDVATLR